LLPKKTVIPKTPSRHQQVLGPVRVMAAVIQGQARDILSVQVTLIEEVLAPIRIMAVVNQGQARDTLSVLVTVLAPIRVMAAVIQGRARDTMSVQVTLIEELLAPIRVMAAVIQGRARDTLSVQVTLMIVLSLRVTRTLTGTYTAIIIVSTHMANLCTKLQRANGTMINGAMIIAIEHLTIQSSLDSRTLTVQSWEFLPISGI